MTNEITYNDVASDVETLRSALTERGWHLCSPLDRYGPTTETPSEIVRAYHGSRYITVEPHRKTQDEYLFKLSVRDHLTQVHYETSLASSNSLVDFIKYRL